MVSLPTVARHARPLAAGYDLRLGPTLWQTAPTPDQPVDFRPTELPTQRLATAENPEDFGASDVERPFSRKSFSGGEGLDVAHRRDGTALDFSRFWSSRRIHVDPARAGEPEILTLLAAPREVVTFAGAAWVQSVAIGSTLFVARDNSPTLEVYDDVFSLAPPATEDPSPQNTNVTAIARIGDQLFVGTDADGVWLRTVLGVWVARSAENVTALWSAKGRLIARGTNPRELFEVAADGSRIDLASLPEGAEWTDLTDAGTHIIASATDGYLYAFTEEAGVLVLEAQSEVQGEQPMSLGASQGLVFIGARQPTTVGGYIGRLYRAEMNGALVDNAQVIRRFGDADSTEDWTPSDIRASRSSAWVWVRDRLWRYLIDTGGIVSDFEGGDIAGHGQVNLIADRVVVAVATEGGDGVVLAQSDDYETDGYLISPAIDFFDDRDKNWSALQLFHAALPPGTRVAIYYSTNRDAQLDPDHPSWQLAAARVGPVPTVDSEISLAGVRSRWLVIKLELGASGSAAPRVYGFAVRAYPTNRELVATLPINVSGWLDAPRRQRVHSPGLAELRWSALLGYRGSEVELEYYRTGIHLRGVVEDVAPPIVAATARGLGTLVATMRVRGHIVVPRTVSVVTGNTFGIPTFGGAVFGGEA